MSTKAICTLVPGMFAASAAAISITAHTTVTEAHVRRLSIVHADGRIHEMNPGVYGGPDAGRPAYYTLSWMSGTGTLFVRRSALNGTMLI